MSRFSIDDIDVAIGQALRSVRLSRTYTQADLAAALGVTRTAVTHYEAGTRSLNAAQLVVAARVLDCAVEELVPAIPGRAAPPLEQSSEPTGPVAQIVHILKVRPELVVNVLDLLETMLQLSTPDAVIEEQALIT
jgi:transcriptional regulator with XRE-family HTH domain